MSGEMNTQGRNMPTDQARELWLEERRSGIGASEIGAICGVNPYSSVLDVYLSKLGISAPKEETAAMKMGIRMESVIADIYAEHTGRELVVGKLTRHPEYDWIFATPDRLVVGEGRGVEIKNTSGRMAYQWGEGDDAAPPAHILQSQWGMLVTGLPVWDLVALIGGEDFRIYTLHADPELHAQLFDIARRFWHDHVLAQVPPPIDASDAWATYLANKYDRHSDALIASHPKADYWVTELMAARSALRVAEEQEQLAMNNLKDLIGPNEGILGDGWKITWKKAKDTLVTDWHELALALTPTPAFIHRFTTAKAGSRRFLFTTPKESRHG